MEKHKFLLVQRDEGNLSDTGTQRVVMEMSLPQAFDWLSSIVAQYLEDGFTITRVEGISELEEEPLYSPLSTIHFHNGGRVSWVRLDYTTDEYVKRDRALRLVSEQYQKERLSEAEFWERYYAVAERWEW